jgi:hypothetical protein
VETSAGSTNEGGSSETRKIAHPISSCRLGRDLARLLGLPNMSSLKCCFAPSVVLLLLPPFYPVVQPVVDQQAICDEVQKYVNALVDYTKTACTTGNTGDGSLSFVILSSEPIFSVAATKKPWLLAVALSIGKALNDQPDLKPGELYVLDGDLKSRFAYAIRVDIVKSLQKSVSASHMKLDAMYEEIEKNLRPKSIPEP